MVQFNSIFRDKERFVLNGLEIPGIQNVDLSFNNNAAPLLYLGMSKINMVPRGSQIGDVSITSLFVTDDYFIQYTGDYGCNGYIIDKRPQTSIRQEVSKFNYVKFPGFISGYLNSYTQSCGLGEVPQIQTTFSAYKNIGLIDSKRDIELSQDWNTIKNDPLDKILKVPNGYNLALNIVGDGQDIVENNRIISYNFSIDIEREGIYVPGERYPIHVLRKGPTIVTCDFQLEIDKYILDYITSFPSNLIEKDISIELYDFETNELLRTYSFDEMKLLDHQRISNVDNNVLVNLKFLGYYVN